MKFNKDNKLAIDHIRDFEKRFDLIVPKAYADFLSIQNGGKLDGLFVFYGLEEYNIDGFLGIGNEEKYFDLSQNFLELAQILPKGFFPIASDSGGNYYLIKLGIKKAPVFFGITTYK